LHRIIYNGLNEIGIIIYQDIIKNTVTDLETQLPKETLNLITTITDQANAKEMKYNISDGLRMIAFKMGR